MNKPQIMEDHYDHESIQENQENDRFDRILIRAISIFGAILGMGILAGFWYWVMMKLFSI